VEARFLASARKDKLEALSSLRSFFWLAQIVKSALSWQDLIIPQGFWGAASATKNSREHLCSRLF
jgi:hypothetical protein